LNASQKSFIGLEEEIENLKIYLRLEQMRFSNQFEYRVEMDPDLEDWMIPTMILQPLLENAILHGIMPSRISGLLTISAKEQDHALHIRITDNGIGLENSQSANQDGMHHSRGIELINKRIKALNHFSEQPIILKMEPLSSDPLHPGNSILLIIPAALYESWLETKA